MTPAVYTLPRNRDAYATIRGYVYQVDLTLRSWLDLEESQHLELERGEDIDLVSRAINASNTAEASRLLEQVKHREQNLTLRNPAALEALVNAVEHLAANPTLELRFRYTTNAMVGRERPCPFPNGTPGIALWEEVRRRQLPGPALSDATTALSRFLSQAERPDGIDATVWDRFQSVVAGADAIDFSELVMRFEWSTAETSARAIAPEILGLLTQRSLASDAPEAELLYQRLFLFVFKRLCEPGIKRLTRADLQQQLSVATLSQSDHATLSRLSQCFAIVRLKVEELEAALTSVTTEVRELARTQGIHGTLLRGTLIIDLTPPPLLARYSQRAEVIGTLAGHLGSSVWTALTGASDTGKSQLVVLLIARVESLAGWVRFGYDMELAAACATLDSAVGMLCNNGRPIAEAGWYKRACGQIGCGKLIVLDDLPRMHGADPLAQRLQLLADACNRAGVRLVSTSHHELPTRLVSSLSAVEITVVPVPMLTEDEVREILVAYEAPEPLLARGVARLIRASTAGHPRLVSLAADYLQDHGWRLSDEEIEGLLRGEHVESVTDEVLDRVMSNLADPQRELLYRLTLPTSAFGFDVAEALSRVAPEVNRPREQLNRLLGAWVQRDAERRFVVSPLVRRVGSENLTRATKVGCHRALGELIVSETMSIYQAEQAIIHFCQAEAFDRAGSLFLFLLNEARTLEPGKDIGLLEAMWTESPLPVGMDLNIRLLARGLQLAVLPKYRRPIDYILTDMDRLMASATEDHRDAVTGVATLAAVYLTHRDPDRTLQYLARAISFTTTLQVGADELFLNEGQQLDDTLWFLVPQLVTAPRLNAWLSILEQLPQDRRQRLLTENNALLGCLVVADQLRLAELAKQVENRQWSNVLAAIDDLRERARAMASGVLEGAALRSSLAIHGEQLRQIDAVTPIALESIRRLQSDPYAVFLAAGMLGRQYAFARRHEDGRPMLEMALAQAAGKGTHERMMTFLSACECFGDVDADRSIRYAQQAVELARTEESIPTIEAARAGAELASATYLRDPSRDGALTVFGTWSEAAERLLECQNDSDEWKDIFVIFTHQTSYLMSMALFGHPPSSTASGEEFSGPIRGVFIRTCPGRVALYQPSSVQTVMWMLSQYASAAGNDQAAAHWLGRASSLTNPTRLTLVEAMIGLDMIPSLITSGKYAEAIDAAMRDCHATLLFDPQGPNREMIEAGVDLEASWNSLQASQREMIERNSAALSVLPAACWVFRKILENSEDGIAQGRSLASACRQISSTATDAAFWTALSDTLERICQERASAHELVNFGNAFGNGPRRVVAIVAYLGASLHGNPDDAFNAQLAVMQALFVCCKPNSTTHRLLLVPYMERFWTNMVGQRRFAFSSPSVVEGALSQARQEPDERRIKAILRAIRLGVTSRADQSTAAWLNAD